MQCDRCGKEGADIYVVKILNGHSVEEHLCRDCMRDVLPVDEVSRMFKVSFSLDGIMQMQDAIKDLLMPMLPGLSGEDDSSIICPHCGKKITFDDVAGLADDSREELPIEEKLKQEMAQAVQEENYERAAVIRDKLKELKHGKEEENRA